MSIRLFAAIVVVATLTGFAPAPKQRPPKGPDPKEMLKNIQGTWQIIGTARVQAGGKGRVTTSTVQIIIDGTTWQYGYAGRDDVRGGVRAAIRTTGTSYVISVDTSNTPVKMDLRRPGAPSPYMRGILTLEGDTLKWCYVFGADTDGAVRPEQFDPIPSGAILMTLKRVKP
jgi:uncharacterized protein (TIGR03067 family)